MYLNNKRRGDYGFDGNMRGVAGMVSLALALPVVAFFCARADQLAAASAAAAIALLLWSTLVIYVHTTRRGKFQVWSEILDALALRGDERVLDVGCGRGAVLTMVARRVPNSRVTGLDIWSAADQSGNAIDVTRKNLAAEEVSATLITGDMRAMPLQTGSFDLVVSSLAIHNVVARADREQALKEIVRVLAPGGRVAIADLAFTADHARTLTALGLVDVKRRGLGWRLWWGPGYPATALITASKPAAP
ncbi:MAG TPA: class I SAM-dependent methyltransferase [Myxococcota bacterium]|jgi:SAM-dependent methyltransferase